MSNSRWFDPQSPTKQDDRDAEDNPSLPASADVAGRHNILVRRRRELQREQYIIQWARKISVLVGLILIALGFTSLRLSDTQLGKIMSLAFIFCALIVVAVAGSQSTQPLEHEISDIDNELDLRAIPVTSHEQKAQKLLSIQQIQLKRYYDQARSQSTRIFFVGIAAMALGFAVIAYSFYYVGVPRGTDRQIEEKLLSAR
jgi:NADH:ubiquinone oxidoreductase subunit K